MDGIKSKERVQEHGEVFTPDSIVNDMLDLVDKELNKENIKEYIDKTFLEPACGNGNFLIRILDRKLNAVQKLDEVEQELWLMHAIASIYAVDIQGDNVEESKERMIELIKNGKVDILELDNVKKKEFNFKPVELSKEQEDLIRYILDCNIQHGDCLTGNRWEREGTLDKETSNPLLITEYIWNNEEVARNLYELKNLNFDISKIDKVNYKDMNKTVINSSIGEEFDADELDF